ncbi:SDR family oxidoreductase [Pseudomonas sp. R5(2019)]|uniref:SDR family oxidoreductase n=1 Tax=Pseudomonas sp. R5(2019) TaxID=2697566 RepID=UPI001412778C|nr:SDR family oxidoreductase [Pseudomonas sp. R5(2019)]NBA98439.1 SDR family oxidoreductase [Pseudomonas sp. R5(2019)]
MSNVKTALIIGASRGLGLGLVERLIEDGWQVTATVRDPAWADALRKLPGVTIKALEMNSTAQLDALQNDLQDKKFDLLFVNAGIKGPANQDPETARQDEIGELFLTNAISPIRLARRFAPQIRTSTGVIAFMSSVLGSVTIPDAPELAYYKASKAALNSMTNSFVSELADPSVTVLAMHPGWVKTDMGGEGADIDVATSTRGLIDQVSAYSGKGGLHFVNYKGENLTW